MKELILLDSDYTDTVLFNMKYISTMRDSDNPLSINTNRGLMKSPKNGDIPYINNVWYN